MLCLRIEAYQPVFEDMEEVWKFPREDKSEESISRLIDDIWYKNPELVFHIRQLKSSAEDKFGHSIQEFFSGSEDWNASFNELHAWIRTLECNGAK